jgi:hypothetical protein
LLSSGGEYLTRKITVQKVEETKAVAVFLHDEDGQESHDFQKQKPCRVYTKHKHSNVVANQAVETVKGKQYVALLGTSDVTKLAVTDQLSGVRWFIM